MSSSLLSLAKKSQVSTPPTPTPPDVLSDPLADTTLQDALPADSAATITKRTRLHISDGVDSDGAPTIDATKPSMSSSGGTKGGNLGKDAEVHVDFDTLDASGKWAKSLDDADGWLKLAKLKGGDPTENYKKGDKYFGLIGDDASGRKGYTRQINKKDARYDASDKPENYDFVNTLAGHDGLNDLKKSSGRSKQMADALAKDPKWSKLVQDKKYQDGLGSHVASQAALEGNLQTMGDDNQIRFLLDGMNVDDALEGGKFSDAATSHELRYVYRNWDRFQGKVSFYKDDQRVPAPWLTDADTWAKRGANKIHDDV
ncbi:MAG TPA: hypothetical protein PKA64_23920 [Myxococcota bacterium]|nr:hypothetical protein [Myxococcota bacterium]